MSNIQLPTMSARAVDTHKGDYGEVFVIAGSETMIGAPAMTALAAFRAGAGLVRLALPKDLIPAVLTICPLATAFAWQPSRPRDLVDYAEEHDVLAIGPGLGNTPATRRLISELLERHRGPMVLDADALNALASLDISEWPKRRDWGNVVLTPHMGEYMRLMATVMKRATPLDNESGAGVEDQKASAAVLQRKTRSLVEDPDDAPCYADGIALDLPEEKTKTETPAPVATAPQTQEPDRTPLAELLARGTGCVVVLKGHKTIVTDGNRSYVNLSGNPGMATAGAGDVLTGVIAALIGQRLHALNAAVLGTYVHGRAGDLAAESIGPIGLLATDIIHHLPKAIAERIAK